jgi:D-serine deaminase-like pyridoxal phosphate-dependent protein
MEGSNNNLSKLDTPCLLLDTARMERNISTLKHRLDGLGARLRPHMKTAKSLEVAKVLLEGTEGHITVSTLKEAEEFADAGITDMIYAVGISPQKLDRINRLRRKGVDLKVILDSKEQASALAEYVKQTADPIGALIEIDCDGNRSGVKPHEKETLLEIARILRDGRARLEGVLTHAGRSYDVKGQAAIAAAAEQERKAVVDAAEILREGGFSCPIVSVGSTPTAYFAEDLTGVTEVRAGVFVFFDLVMAGIGVCATDDIALSVLTTVIGHEREKGWVIVDAGWMAMSRDRGTSSQDIDQGYGLVCTERGEVIDDLIMASANQEHGIIARRNEGPAPSNDLLKELPVGTRLRILPNHACATAAQHQEYQLIENNQHKGVWTRFNGW